MKCEKCGADTKVLDSRSVEGKLIRRRRQCLTCKARFTTFEITDSSYKANVNTIKAARLAHKLTALAGIVEELEDVLGPAKEAAKKELDKLVEAQRLDAKRTTVYSSSLDKLNRAGKNQYDYLSEDTE